METTLCLLLSRAVSLMSGCPTSTWPRHAQRWRFLRSSRTMPHRPVWCAVPDAPTGCESFPGSIGPGLVATSWRVPSIECEEGGEVPSPILWAALDCPGGWCFEGAHVEFVPVLVSQSVDILKPIHAGDEVIIVAWETGRAERTLRACTAALDFEGRPLAVSKQTCVGVPATWVK